MSAIYSLVYPCVITVILTILLIYHDRGWVKRETSREKMITDVSQRLEEIEGRCLNSNRSRNIEAEREFLEHRLNSLWGLSELKKSLDEMRDSGDKGWKGTTEEEDDIAWVYVYCQREIRKIGKRLRELDAESNKAQSNKE